MSTKDRIIEHATVMFKNSGLRGVRMDDIANELGISKRTIYETFGDKEALIAACVRHFFEEKSKVECERGEGANNIVEELLMNLKGSEDNVQKGFVLMSDLRKFYPKLHKSIADECFEIGVEHIRVKLREGAREGVISDKVDIDIMVPFFADLMQTVTRRLNDVGMQKKDNNMAARALQYAVIFFVRGVATQRGIEMIDQYLEKNIDQFIK